MADTKNDEGGLAERVRLQSDVTFLWNIERIRETGRRIDERLAEIDKTKGRVDEWLNRRLQQDR